MKINVIEQPSLVMLEKRYNWKFPRLAWNDPKQVLLSVSAQYHSRYDEEHYRTCDPCYQDHLDLLYDCEMDARED